MELTRRPTPERSTVAPLQESGDSRPVALCLHEIPGESPHLDLFLGPSGPFQEDDRVLDTWRLPSSPMDLARSERIPIEALDLHRGKYVRLDAPIVPSNGIGRVSPLLRGCSTARAKSGGVRELLISWTDGSSCHLSLTPLELTRLDGSENESR